MNIPKEIIIATLQEIHTAFNITPNQIKITNYDDYMIVIWRDEYGYKEKLKIVYDEDFKRPDLVISNQQFSYNNKLYQLLYQKSKNKELCMLDRQKINICFQFLNHFVRPFQF